MSLIKHGIWVVLFASAVSGLANNAPNRDIELEGRLSSLVQRVDPNAIVLVRSTALPDSEQVDQVDVKILSALPDFPRQIVTLVRQLCAHSGAAVTVQVKPLPTQLMPITASPAPATFFSMAVAALASPAANSVLLLVALASGLISVWAFVLIAALGVRRAQITFMNGVAHLSDAVRDGQSRALPTESIEPQPALQSTVATAPAIILTAARSPSHRNTDTLDNEFCARSFIEQERLMKSALDLQK